MWDEEFDRDYPSDEDKAGAIWGNSDVDPWTGRPTDDDSD
jgi:hypothetical protein